MPDNDHLIIVGNGPSLLQLSAEEKGQIQAGPSISLNHFLLHSQEAGFTTTHYALIDDMEPARKAFRDLPQLLNGPDWSHATCLLSPYWREQLHGSSRPGQVLEVSGCNGISQLIKWTIRRDPSFYNYFIHNPTAIWNRLQGKEIVLKRQEKFEALWPQHPSDPLVWINGTLLIALSYAFREGYRDVRLVGVDLNDGTHFYSPKADVIAYDSRRFQTDTLKTHTTLMWGFPRPSPPIQYLITWVREIYEKDGRRLSVANQNSMLAREGVLAFRPLLAADHELRA